MIAKRPLTWCTAAAVALSPVAFAAPAAAATRVVTIQALKYTPVPPLQVGDVVVFVNRDLFRHSVTASNGRFNLDLMPGARGGLRINSAGNAEFYCKYHPGMRGVMVAK
jgi:plastocyanin